MIWILLVVLAVALVPTFVTLVLYLIWHYDRRNFKVPPQGGKHEPLPSGAVVRAVLFEAGSFTLLAFSYLLRVLNDLFPGRVHSSDRRPVMLIHGYGGNSANFLCMQRRLRRCGFANVYAVSYTPPHINVRKLAAQVVRHVDNVLARTGADQVDLVCHSMGGPLVRYALKNLGLAGKVNKVITLGSPHYGSRISALFPARGAAAQMRYLSPFVKELAEGGECPGNARFYCLYSEMDSMVLPASTATLASAEQNLHLPYLGHCALLYSPRVARAVCDRLLTK